jgi:hypothetical protein
VKAAPRRTASSNISTDVTLAAPTGTRPVRAATTSKPSGQVSATSSADAPPAMSARAAGRAFPGSVVRTTGTTRAAPMASTVRVITWPSPA